MNHRRFLFTGLAALVGVAALLALRAGGQVSPNTANTPSTVVEIGPDGALIERTFEGELLRVTQQEAGGAQNPAGPRVEYEYHQRPDGSVERRTVTVPVEQGGRTFYVQPGYGPRYPAGDTPHTPDAESQKLMAEEQALAQAVRKLAADAQKAASTGEPSDAKALLRQKLIQIFDLQQQRRTREIAKIEERLGKLKETLKKRDSAKDSIVDRRLETLTGGVDELGWEESFSTHVNPYGERTPMFPNPLTAPRPTEPRFTPPPAAIAPRAGAAVPSPVPQLPETAPIAPALPAPPTPSAPAAPPVAPAPVALPAPAAGR